MWVKSKCVLCRHSERCCPAFPGPQLVTAEVAADGLRWGAPQGVLSEQADGPVPKVIANPPIVDPRTGHWVLPFWRETPRGEVVCPTKAPGGDYASVLISQDEVPSPPPPPSPMPLPPFPQEGGPYSLPDL